VEGRLNAEDVLQTAFHLQSRQSPGMDPTHTLFAAQIRCEQWSFERLQKSLPNRIRRLGFLPRRHFPGCHPVKNVFPFSKRFLVPQIKGKRRKIHAFAV
jgi:hypothetical protein